MKNKREKKQWLRKKLAESTAALATSTVFMLSPVQPDAARITHAEKKPPILDRIESIKRTLAVIDSDVMKDDSQPKKKDRLAQGWGNWPNWGNSWRNW
jgi:hypothetical protein